ncbi:hypothetical protein PLESTB_001942900 [Pleodorina starrii]|uniref:Chloride conductance regulatory protein ICln n=1 Tax=Pleodorina starrii TaxID=330485 RepID=A0A9W6FAU9_9CHLO|nr:hypothetical protein PLESTM_000993100 [Pleodorina starrii]GLC62817.1 hypothetical protein PLESTB_001942900 [Pleodorina starrii]GLC77403.1 hypothetical protein PLESTF_001930800 [Pleodorina starrii]
MTSSIAAAARKLGVDTDVSLTEARDVVLETADEEELTSKCPGVDFVLGDDMNAGAGVLHLTTRRVVWVSSQPSGPAFALRYQQIMMHAISRDPTSYAKPCIYLQLDEGSEDMGMGGAGGDGEEEEEEEQVSAEVRLVPAEDAKVDEIFKVLCDCAALNPDSEVEGEGDFFFDEAEVMAGLDPQTRAAVIADRLEEGMDLDDQGEGEAMENGTREDLEQLVGNDPSRFEDDEEEDEGQGQPDGAQ